VLYSILALTALSVIAAPVLGRVLGRSAGWPLAGLLGAAGVVLWWGAGSEPISHTVPWMPTLGIEFALLADGLAIIFALLVLLIGALVLAYCSGYLGAGSQSSFHLLMTLFALAMLVLVLADDVVVLFVAWEITTLCSFFLIARSGPSAREPAIRTLLVTVAGGLSLLVAVVMMAVAAGTTSLSAILSDPLWSDRPGLTAAVAVLVALAAFTKSAQFPFQAWLPDAMAAITPVSAYLHAAAMVKAGIYLLLRFSPLFGQVPVWNALLIGAGLTTAIFGAVAALRRHDLKELLAYSTVSQLGFLVAVIGVGTEAAMIAAVVHTVAHALFKSALFLLVGVIDNRTGTRDLRQLAGLPRRLPVTVVAISVAAVSMAGVPPMLGFISKESVFEALWTAPFGAAPLLGAAAVLAAVLTFAYSGRIVLGLWLGEPGEQASAVREAPAWFWLPAVLPAGAGLVLGLAPFWLDELISAGATAAAGARAQAHLALWHGVNPALIMSLVAIGGGLGLVLARAPVDRFLADKALPVSGLDVVDRIRAGTIAFGRWVGAPTASNAPARHLAVPIVMVVLIAVVGLARLVPLPQVAGARSQPLDWVLVVLIVIGVAGAVRAPTRVAAVVVTGVVGFTTTLWYYVLGAADVALTQLLVEILTVMVMVLVLRRLPKSFRPASTRRRLGAGVLALAAGAATTVGVLALTGRRPLSPAGEYYLTEGEEVTGGQNVVNTILVDFRALDTLGELTVLGVAGVTVAAILAARRPLPVRKPDPPLHHGGGLADAGHNTVFLRTLQRGIGPAVVVASALFLFRGHQLPGGGFIAALIGGAGLTLTYLAASKDKTIRVSPMALIGSGVMVGTGIGLVGLAGGSFLQPLHAYLFDIHLTTALVFDAGVYLAVVGVVLASVNLLGSQQRPRGPQPPADEENTKEVSRR